MKHIFKTLNGNKMIINDDQIDNLAPLSEIDEDKTWIKLKNGFEIIVDEPWDNVFRAVNERGAC